MRIDIDRRHLFRAATAAALAAWAALPVAAQELEQITQLNTPRVFSLILYLSLVGLALFAFVVWLQRRFVFWHRDRVVTGEA